VLEKILIRITDRLPCRLIDGPGGEPYLERYYLFGLFGWHAYLHRFVDSDPDRGLHDHPWGRALSLVLTGGYREIRYADPASETTQERRIRPGRLNRLRGEDFHRVVLERGIPAWTLFLHGPRCKGWGFRRNGQYTEMARDAAEFRHRDWWKQAPNGRAARALRSLPADG
jgi:hypothetical protein